MWKKFSFFVNSIIFRLKKHNYSMQSVLISNQSYLVRRMTPSDIKDVLAIEREVYAGELPWTKSAFLNELRASSQNLYLLIQDNKQVIGFIGCRVLEKDAHITNVAVLNKYQGKGIGSFLLNETRTFAEKHQCETMSLEVRMSNKNAQRVYRRMGFVSNAIKRGYYDENKEDALDMILYLKEV
ncbi:ribosomal protein S18-alanine N-acetyltransferase [Enterococcus rivorum]|uniref:Ribosomal-protein-alanine N-acetyltransferase n=1 Tax=Enterococcus rivorum TaxID=762845 RepID=A0A1E5KXT4_9ENTE|nr:ribosomal protein S18-alanine N-acetyltransferase [Enterococcus rivorum]MBP2099773.1 ribosomal-protein-alanine N-acetyltransferase [Enterococcus rivorum]OEH82643.1 ribosomal-protein-alanine N-acetyltransferase [Enterococcus rivorum]